MTAEELHKEFKDCSLSDAMPSEEQIRHNFEIYRKILCGRRTELRGMRIFYMQGQKAVAVFQGKAELSMCMPYALTQAESMSNVVMDVTPNMIFVIWKRYEDIRLQQERAGSSRSRTGGSGTTVYF